MVDELRAEAGIRRLHARYADAVFRKDYMAFGDCFTEAAQWRVGGHVLQGRGACVDFLQDRMARLRWVFMDFRTPLLEIGDGVASGRSYVTEQSAFADGTQSSSLATYFERFVEDQGVWRRAWALFQIHYIGPADLTGRFLTQPDYGPPPAMPPDDDGDGGR
jgi:hypothetical protein